MKRWTVKQLLGEMAAILVRLENDRADDAQYMAEIIVKDTKYYSMALLEYKEMGGGDINEDVLSLLTDHSD